MRENSWLSVLPALAVCVLALNVCKKKAWLQPSYMRIVEASSSSFFSFFLHFLF